MNTIYRLIQLQLLCLLSFLLTSSAWADSADSKSGVTPNVLILPKGPGSLEGVGENIKANLNMGLMSYGVNIKLPEGRNKLSPSLAFSYSSGTGSGVVGIGWSLQGVSSIERLTVRGLPQYKSSDDFFTSDNGELVKIPGTPHYRSRFEGKFIRYRWHAKDSSDQKGYWTAELPNGVIEYYGALPDGTLDAESQVSGTQGTFRWHLRAKVDPNGNRIEYSYFKESQQVYLSKLSWVFKDKKSDPLYTVDIRYEDRPDPISDGKPGFDLTTKKRIAEVLINSEGKRLRSYSLEFEEQTGLSRLQKVTQYGVDAKKAYPIQFTMQYTDATFSPENSRMVKMSTGVGQNFKARNSDLIDMNGDGLPDVVDTTNAKHRFHINTLTVKMDPKKGLVQDTHDYPQTSIKENLKSTSAQLSNASVQMLDFDGDGFTDMVDAVNQKIYINKGNSRWEDSSPKLMDNFPGTAKDPNTRFFDYNGDKAIDIINSNGTTTTYWVSNKDGTWTKVSGGAGIGASFTTDKVRLIDMNGDGLQDAVQIFEGKLRYKKYYGYGKWSGWIVVEVPGLTQSLSDSAQFADINGDSLSDMVVFQGDSIQYFVNQNGIKFSAGQTLKKFAGIDIPDSTSHSIRIADINGNGSRDIVWIDSSGKLTYLELFGTRPNLMKMISNGIGKRIELTYGSSVYHRIRDEKAGKPWPNKLPIPAVVVNTIKTWAEGDSTFKPTVMHQQILYHDGYYDGKEKKFHGFQRVESVMLGDTSVSDKKETIEFDVGDKDLYLKGKMMARDTSDNKGNIFFSEIWEWGDCQVAGIEGLGANPPIPVRFVCMKSTEKTHKEGQSKDKWKTTRTEYKRDGYGNTILTSELGDKDKKGDEKYTETTYVIPKDRWFVRKIQRRQIYADPSGKRRTDERFYYDGEAFKGLPEGQLTKGNLTRSTTKISPDGDKVIEAQRSQYDEYGNATAQLDGNGSKREIVWDDKYQRFPVKETAFLKDYKIEYETVWSFRFGVVTKSTDWNGHATLYTYDNFARIVATIKPGDTPDKPTIEYTYDLGSPFSRLISQKRTKRGGPLDLKQVDCFDGQGRKLQTHVLISSGKYQVQKHTLYNNSNTKAQVWNTYSSDTEKCSFVAPKDVPSAQFQYDGLGRLARQIQQDNSEVRNVYLPFETKMYDEEDNRKGSPHFDTPKTSIRDGLDRVLQVVEMDRPGHTITKKFTWDSVNTREKGLPMLVQFENAAGNKKSQKLDLLGRVVEVNDPDTGVIRYEYDAANNRISRTDARGVTTVTTYDALNRKLSEQEKGKDETRISYTYDRSDGKYAQGINLKGKIASTSYPAGKEEFGFDARGNLTGYRKTLLGHAFAFTMTYDGADRLLTKTFPDGRKLEYQQDALGRVTNVSGWIKEFRYAPNGQISQWVGENNVTTEYQYDKRERLYTIKVGDGKVLDYKYQFDSNGNITSLNDGAVTQTYGYDSLYRLTQASLVTKEDLTYKYDDIGNILLKSSSLGDKSPAHVGSYEYTKERPHAVTKAGSMQLDYDKAGHAKSHRGMQYTWDFMGRCKQVQKDGKPVVKYWYSNSKKRLLKEEGGLHTIYVTNDYEVRNGAGVISLISNKSRFASSKSVGIAKILYDDLAPASVDGKNIKSQPDGAITASDAWLYQQVKAGTLQATLKKRPVSSDLTGDMLSSSLERMFLEAKAGGKEFYHLNRQGSTVAVTNEQGASIAQVRYYPYGAIREHTGAPVVYGYMGTEMDTTTKLHSAKTRSLDTQLGRWTSADGHFERLNKIDAEFNSYWYVANNPLRYTDQNGTFGALATVGLAVLGGVITHVITHPIESINAVGTAVEFAGRVLSEAGPVYSGTGEIAEQVGRRLQEVGAPDPVPSTLVPPPEGREGCQCSEQPEGVKPPVVTPPVNPGGRGGGRGRGRGRGGNQPPRLGGSGERSGPQPNWVRWSNSPGRKAHIK